MRVVSEELGRVLVAGSRYRRAVRLAEAAHDRRVELERDLLLAGEIEARLNVAAREAREELIEATMANDGTLSIKGDSMGIGDAVKAMQDGKRVARGGWNGKGMYVALQVPDEHSANTLPYVWMRTADGQRVPWLCSQTDLLATDWAIALTGD